jgi:hypothetical protein
MPWIEPCSTSHHIRQCSMPCSVGLSSGTGDARGLAMAFSAQSASWWNAVPGLRVCQAQLTPIFPYPPLPCPTPRRSNLVGGRPALSLVVVPGSPDFSPGPGCLGHLLLVVRLVGYPFVGCRLSATRIKTPQVFSRRKPCQAPLHPHAHSQPAMVTNKAARGRIGRSRRYPSASAHNPSPLDRPLPIVV